MDCSCPVYYMSLTLHNLKKKTRHLKKKKCLAVIKPFNVKLGAQMNHVYAKAVFFLYLLSFINFNRGCRKSFLPSRWPLARLRIHHWRGRRDPYCLQSLPAGAQRGASHSQCNGPIEPHTTYWLSRLVGLFFRCTLQVFKWTKKGPSRTNPL